MTQGSELAILITQGGNSPCIIKIAAPDASQEVMS